MIRRKIVGVARVGGVGDAEATRAMMMTTTTSGSKQQPRAVYFMGLPGAGKSTLKRQLFGEYTSIDPDAIKREHEDWREGLAQANEKTDRKIHVWSVKRAVSRLRRCVDMREDYVMDASGSDCLWLRDQIETALDGGFHVSVVFAVVPLEIALKRNVDRFRRSGGKEHFVPERVVEGKAECMRDSFSRARRYADEVWVLINYSEKELRACITQGKTAWKHDDGPSGRERSRRRISASEPPVR
mmetsp:Transcript_8856/g.17359  ORF Transcript_8856/g.17359 Transcript_8856/m.17359 type:complete len:242 (-) Transcript_8856:27-752(-)